jgi:hypothetical protein
MMLERVQGLDAAIEQVTARVEAEIAPYQAVVDRLDTNRGFNRRAAQVIVAELGVDMSRFPRRRSWRPGPGCARATTSRPASTSLRAHPQR